MRHPKRADNPVILAIRLRQLGDVLATLGTLRAIKSAAPASRIAFMVDEHYHPLLANVAFIDTLLPQPPKFRGLSGAIAYNQFIDGLRGLGADYALDFHSNVRSALIAFLSGAPNRIGFDVRGRKVLYTDVEPRAAHRNGQVFPRTSHESAMALARRCALGDLQGSVVETISVKPEERETGRRALVAAGIDFQTIQNGDLIGLNPGNPYPAKEWGDRRFVELAREIVLSGKQVVVMWGPGEHDRAQRIVQAAGADVLLAPGCRIEQLPGVLSNVSQLVTIDSGLKHLAVAIGVATITLFGPTHPDEWHMGGDSDRYVFADLSCSPCRLLECPFGTPCMERISPADVWQKLLASPERVHVV
jgi:heptosyltransferase-2